jgi:hypothetical protein
LASVKIETRATEIPGTPKQRDGQVLQPAADGDADGDQDQDCDHGNNDQDRSKRKNNIGSSKRSAMLAVQPPCGSYTERLWSALPPSPPSSSSSSNEDDSSEDRDSDDDCRKSCKHSKLCGKSKKHKGKEKNKLPSRVKAIPPKPYDRSADIDMFDCWVYETTMYFRIQGIKDDVAMLLLAPLVSGKAEQYFMQTVMLNSTNTQWTVKDWQQSLYNHCFPQTFCEQH